MLRGSVINKFSQLSPGSFIHSVGISNETSFSYPQTIHAEAEEGHRRAFARSTATLRYEPCTQFINVSQRALHIYFIDGCRRIKSKTKTATCEQAPRSLFLF